MDMLYGLLVLLVLAFLLTLLLPVMYKKYVSYDCTFCKWTSGENRWSDEPQNFEPDEDSESDISDEED